MRSKRDKSFAGEKMDLENKTVRLIFAIVMMMVAGAGAVHSICLEPITASLFPGIALGASLMYISYELY
jgi:hypothetical protein